MKCERESRVLISESADLRPRKKVCHERGGFESLPNEIVLLILEKLAEDGVGATAPVPWVCRRWNALFKRGSFAKLKRSRACENFAYLGSVSLLKWAREQHKCPWNKWTCDVAALCGHVGVLKYAHEHGCHWDEWTCVCAACGGHLGALKYAREHGCPCGSKTRSYADASRHPHILEYLHANGCRELY